MCQTPSLTYLLAKVMLILLGLKQLHLLDRELIFNGYTIKGSGLKKKITFFFFTGILNGNCILFFEEIKLNKAS